MNKIIPLITVCISLTAHAQESPIFRPNKSGGGTFTGGTLTSPIVLDATNTLCSQALALSFNGDSDTGLQRAAANIVSFCVGATEALRLSTTTVDIGGGSGSTGVSIDSATGDLAATRDIIAGGDVNVNGADINTTATGAVTIFNANATSASILAGATGAIDIAGGVGSTGCTITANTGALACTATPTFAGGSGITGTIANQQVAVGNGTNTIAGSSALTFDGSTFLFTAANTRYTSRATDNSGEGIFTVNNVNAGDGSFVAEGPNVAGTFGGINKASAVFLTLNPASATAFIRVSGANPLATVTNDVLRTYIDTSGNFSVGNNASPAGLFSVGSASQLQVDSTGRMSRLETSAPSGVASRDLVWADSTSHRMMMNNNNQGAVAVAGVLSAVVTSDLTTTGTTLQTALTVALPVGTFRCRVNGNWAQSNAAGGDGYKISLDGSGMTLGAASMSNGDIQRSSVGASLADGLTNGGVTLALSEVSAVVAAGFFRYDALATVTVAGNLIVQYADQGGGGGTATFRAGSNLACEAL